jgi:hypothetical protein
VGVRETLGVGNHREAGSDWTVDVPDDTAAALRLLKVLEECRQMSPSEVEAWRQRIERWARFNAVTAETSPSAQAARVTSTRTTIAG